MKLETFLDYFSGSTQITIIDFSCGAAHAATLVPPQELGQLCFSVYRRINRLYVLSAQVKNDVLEIKVSEFGKE